MVSPAVAHGTIWVMRLTRWMIPAAVSQTEIKIEMSWASLKHREHHGSRLTVLTTPTWCWCSSSGCWGTAGCQELSSTWALAGTSNQSKFCQGKWRRMMEEWWSSPRRSRAPTWTRTCPRLLWTEMMMSGGRVSEVELILPWWRSRPWRICWRPGLSAEWCSPSRGRTAPPPHCRHKLKVPPLTPSVLTSRRQWSRPPESWWRGWRPAWRGSCPSRSGPRSALRPSPDQIEW